jgi:predicted nucleic acid-binding Zn ribbon protein
VPTYVYETISKDHGAETRRFEVFQRITDAPLTVDPGTGQPVVRVVTGGLGIRLKGPIVVAQQIMFIKRIV